MYSINRDEDSEVGTICLIQTRAQYSMAQHGAVTWVGHMTLLYHAPVHPCLQALAQTTDTSQNYNKNHLQFNKNSFMQSHSPNDLHKNVKNIHIEDRN